MRLHCRATGETIEVPAGQRVVLGREAHGRGVLRVPQISRQHCAVEYVDGSFCVTDLGSSHGTFVGVDRRDCRIAPGQPLRNGELLVLGREEFFAEIDGGDGPDKTVPYEAPEPTTTPLSAPPPADFECRNCRKYRAPEPPPDRVCPLCSGYTPPGS